MSGRAALTAIVGAQICSPIRAKFMLAVWRRWLQRHDQLPGILVTLPAAGNYTAQRLDWFRAVGGAPFAAFSPVTHGDLTRNRRLVQQYTWSPQLRRVGSTATRFCEAACCLEKAGLESMLHHRQYRHPGWLFAGLPGGGFGTRLLWSKPFSSPCSQSGKVHCSRGFSRSQFPTWRCGIAHLWSRAPVDLSPPGPFTSSLGSTSSQAPPRPTVPSQPSSSPPCAAPEPQTSSSQSRFYEALPWPSIGKPTEYMVHELHTLAELLSKYKTTQKVLLVLFGALLCGSSVLLLKWDEVKQKVGTEGADVLRVGISNADLVITVSDFTKALLNDVIADPAMAAETSKFLLQVFERSKEDLAPMVVHLLRSEPVVAELQRMGVKLAAYLCGQDDVQHMVANLLLKAIFTSEAKTGAAQWVNQLLQDPSVIAALEQAIAGVLQQPFVQQEVTHLAQKVGREFLQSHGTMKASEEYLHKLVSSPAFQEFAGEAVWSIIKHTFSPKWLSVSGPTFQTLAGDVNSHDTFWTRQVQQSFVPKAGEASLETRAIHSEPQQAAGVAASTVVTTPP